MNDRVTQYPHRYQLVPVSGESDTYDIIAKPGTVTEVGTPLNKATLLKDATATLYGITGDDATVDKALESLAKTLIAEISVPLQTAFGSTTFVNVDVTSYLAESDYDIYLIKYTGTLSFTCQAASNYQIGFGTAGIPFRIDTPASGTLSGIQINATDIVIKAQQKYNSSGAFVGFGYITPFSVTPSTGAAYIFSRRGAMNAVRVSSGSVTAKIYGCSKI